MSAYQSRLGSLNRLIGMFRIFSNRSSPNTLIVRFARLVREGLFTRDLEGPDLNRMEQLLQQIQGAPNEHLFFVAIDIVEEQMRAE